MELKGSAGEPLQKEASDTELLKALATANQRTGTGSEEGTPLAIVAEASSACWDPLSARS